MCTTRMAKQPRTWILRLIILALPLAAHGLLWVVSSANADRGIRFAEVIQPLLSSYLVIGIILFLAPKIQSRY